VKDSDEIIRVSPDLFRKRALLAAFEIVKVLNRDEMRLYDNGRYLVYLNLSEYNTMLSRAIGFFERKKFLLTEKLLAAGATFLDLGGNKGDFALFAGAIVGPTGQVFCFEPLPSNVEWINRSIEKNDFSHVKVVEACVMAKPGEAILHVGQKSGWNSIFARTYDTPQLKCRGITLDDFIAEQRLQHVDLVKIDIEGAELQALSGASKMLKDLRPIMLVDVHRHVIGNEGVALLAGIVEANDYVILNDRDMARVAGRAVSNSTVFAPREKVDRVLEAHNSILQDTTPVRRMKAGAK
jgi:FkbM family methyltransferase